MLLKGIGGFAASSGCLSRRRLETIHSICKIGSFPKISLTKKRSKNYSLLLCDIFNLDDYPEQLIQPSSIEQTGPSIISSALCSICSGITGSIFLPAWFSTVNLTA
jgi:hypothetical protein